MLVRSVLQTFDALPFAGLDAIIGSGRPLVLAPHPDDESLGCGGLIAACCARGTAPRVVILTDGAGSHPGSRTHAPPRLRALRAQEARDAVKILGLASDNLSFLGLADTATPMSGPMFDHAVREIARIAADDDCDVILAPWRRDPHCDHETADAMARAVAALTGASHLSYPVWGWTLPADGTLPDEPIIGWRFDISEHRTAKAAAIAAHGSQYGGLITDDPAGFTLPTSLLSVFARDFEVFIRA